MSKTSRVILSVSLIMGLAVAAAVAAPAPVLPGITAKDGLPNGCLDCHKAGGANGVLNVALKQVKGHPDVTKIVKTVPTDCALCHKATGKTPSLALVAHQVHFKNPTTNAFVTTNGGQCLSCHSLNADTGEMKVKSAAANW